MSEQIVVAMGVHVLDVLVRPVTEIPEGQGGALVEQIKLTAAGSAGGTALVLSRLGASVRSAGAIGTDALGDALLALLARDGVDTTHLLRRDEVQTSASVLPIRPDGSRPAFHVIGANATYGPEEVTDALLDDVTHLHLGGPEFLGGEKAAEILARAKARGVTTSADVLAPGDMGVLEWIAAALPSSTSSCPTTSRCSASPAPATSRPAAACWSSAASAASPRRAAATACCWSTPTARSPSPRPPSRSSTRPAAATPSRPASCAGWGSAAGARRRRGWAARWRGSSPAGSAPTTAPTTSRRPTRSSPAAEA